MAEHWMQKAFGNSHGQFKAKAKKAGESTEAYATKVTKPGSYATAKTKRQANLAKLGAKYGGGHAHHASQPHPKTNPGEYDNSAHPVVGDLQENPGEADMHMHPRVPMGQPHVFRPPATSAACGYGHSAAQCKGPLRMSGNSGAHRIGKR
jgi:hypothetical protein